MAAVIVSMGVAAPAAATDHRIIINGWAACDREAVEWVITWHLENHSGVAGTLGNVRMEPADRPLVDLPSRILPGETVTGVQRLPRNEHAARLSLDVNWDDGHVSYNVTWPTYIKNSCNAN